MGAGASAATVPGERFVIRSPFPSLSATAAFALFTRIPDVDLRALGFVGPTNHPCNAILNAIPVLPPVSRPSMRTLNLKTGQPFVVEVRSTPLRSPLP